VHRLEGLMWSDWHSDVRSAAAQALAGTGHGLVVHDSVLDRMCDSSHIVRCDALRRLGQLGSSIQLESVNWLIEHGFTSAPTQYRLYGRRFLVGVGHFMFTTSKIQYRRR